MLLDMLQSGEYRHNFAGFGPDGSARFEIERNPVTEAGAKTRATQAAQEPFTVRREERALGYKYPEAVQPGGGVNPTFPGTEAKRAETTRRTNALKLAQKQSAEITAAVTKATSDEEFIKGVLTPIEALIPELPDKEYRGLTGAVTSAGRKIQRGAGTFFETDTLALKANVLANTIVTNVG